MNSTIRHRPEVQNWGARRLPIHPLEAPLADHCAGVAVEGAIVRYRPLIARIIHRRHHQRSQVRRPRVRSHFQCAVSIPEHRVRMPKCLKLMMDHGTPIGARQMKDAWSGEDYFKFNGVLGPRLVTSIALYLLCISENERKDIIERLMLHCPAIQLGLITKSYQQSAALIQRKNLAKIFLNLPIVCDEAGSIH